MGSWENLPFDKGLSTALRRKLRVSEKGIDFETEHKSTLSIKAHLSTVPEEAFEVINHDALTWEEPLKYHAAPFHSSPIFWTVPYRRERALLAAGTFVLRLKVDAPFGDAKFPSQRR